MIRRLSIVSASVLLLLLPSMASAGSKGASDRIIGLLELPQLFGTGACSSYDPKPLALFELATSVVPIGEVRVDTPWIIDANGGCHGLKVSVHLNGANANVQEFPTREFGYEEPGAVVYARHGNRFKIALRDGPAWVEPSAGVLHPMETLVAEGLSYLTDRWDGMVCAQPGKPATCRKVDAGADPQPGVMVLEYREIEDALWFEIKLPSTETCGEPAPVMAPVRGWVSGHDNDGEPAIWFYSRGC